jgi:hypothetical protein
VPVSPIGPTTALPPPVPLTDSQRPGQAGGRTAAIIVAHPDDETLWAGGMILAHPEWHWYVAGLCRASDPDRAPKFRRALERLRARGALADLDDGPEQIALPNELVQETILSLLLGAQPGETASFEPFDLVLTHGPCGEYIRHRRHEETSRAVTALWQAGQLPARALWFFAYEDGGGAYLPRPAAHAHLTNILPEGLWQEKYALIADVYGFAPDSWEARCTPRSEGFSFFDRHP